MSALALGLSELLERLWAAAAAAGLLSVALAVRLGLDDLALGIAKKGILWAVLVALVQLGISNLWVEVLSFLSVDLETQALLQEERSVALVAYVVLGAPIFEELLFRGFLLPRMIKEMGVIWAISLNGIAFGLMHWSSLQAVPPLICFGIMLAFLRWKHESTTSCLVAHFINNATVLLLL